MARPRKFGREHWPPGLYRNGNGLFWYKNARTGKTKILGSEEKIAVLAARKLHGIDSTGYQPIKVDHTLLDESSIVAESKPYGVVVGVYFLIFCSKIVYVGQSIDVAARIASHWKDPSKIFDATHVIPCDVSQLTQLELRYIRQFSPQFNIVGTRYVAE